MRPWGSIKLDIYGGSHEKRMGLTMELPKGLRLDGEIISRDIERRRGVSKKRRYLPDGSRRSNIHFRRARRRDHGRYASCGI